MAGRFKIAVKGPPPRNDCHLGSRLRIKTECQDGPFPTCLCFSEAGRRLLLPGVDVAMYKVMVPIVAEIHGG
jgi:hypothetical protein